MSNIEARQPSRAETSMGTFHELVNIFPLGRSHLGADYPCPIRAFARPPSTRAEAAHDRGTGRSASRQRPTYQRIVIPGTRAVTELPVLSLKAYSADP